MRDIYKSIKLYMGYIKYISKNNGVSFNDYLKYLMDNKKILEEYLLTGKNNTYRIHYVSFPWENGMVLRVPSSVLVKPNGMSQEDAFKVISYVSRFYLQQNNPKMVNDIEFILVNRFGFSYSRSLKDECTLDLFFTDNLFNFINSKYYDIYFSWFVDENVSLGDIINIYDSINPEISLKLKKHLEISPK